MDHRITPAGRLGAALSGRPVPPGPRSIIFTALDTETLEHLDILDPRPADLDTAVSVAASIRGVSRVTHGRARIGVDVLPDRPRRSWVSRVIVLPVIALLATIGVLAGLAATASSAQAATTPVKGPGLTLKAEGHAVHVGPYKYGTRLLYCTDWGLQVGNGDVRKGTGAPRLDAETRARVNTLVNTYGQTTDNREAARVKLAVDTLIAPKDIRLRKALPGMLAQMTVKDRAAITRMVTESATHAPYRVSKTLTGAVPGQNGTAVVTVLGSNGKPATGRVVVYILTGATIPGGTVKTDTNGKAVLTYTAAGLGQSMTADITTPSSTAVWQNTPSKGHQLMVGGGYTDTIRVSDVAELCPITMTVTTHCDCDKDGMRKVDVTFTAAGLPGAYRVAVLTDGAVRTEQALASGETITITLTLPRGTDVAGRWTINGTDYTEDVTL